MSAAQRVYDGLVCEEENEDRSYAMHTAVVAYIYFVSEGDPHRPNVQQAFGITDHDRSSWPVRTGESRSLSGRIWQWEEVGNKGDPRTHAFEAFRALVDNGLLFVSSLHPYWLTLGDKEERKESRSELDRRLIARREPFVLALSHLFVADVRSLVVDYAVIPPWNLILPEMPLASECPHPAVVPRDAIKWFPPDLFADADARGIRKPLQDTKCRYCHDGHLTLSKNEWVCASPNCPLKRALQ